MTVSHGSIAEPLEAVYPERLIQPPSGLQSHWSALHCEYHRETKAGEQMKMCDPAIWGIGPSCQPNQAVQCSTCTRNVHTSGSSLMFKKNANYLHLIFIFNFQLVNSSLSPFGAKDIQCNRLAGIRFELQWAWRYAWHISPKAMISTDSSEFTPKKGFWDTATKHFCYFFANC